MHNNREENEKNMANYNDYRDSKDSDEIQGQYTNSGADNGTNTCRTCLTEDNKQLLSIFSQCNSREYYNELLQKYAGVNISKEDQFPHFICNVCVYKLMDFHKFAHSVRDIDKKLRLSAEKLSFAIKEEQKFAESNSFDDDEDFEGISDFEENPSSSDSSSKPKKSTAKKKKATKTENKEKPKKDVSLQNDCNSLVCADCGLVLKSYLELQDHMKSHTGEKPFSCDKCGKAFAMEFTLQCHIRKVHERAEMIKAQKNPICKTCGKKFRWLKDLAVHMRLHTGEMPYLCTYCAKSFAQLSTLYRHIRTHTGEKPYSCKTCGKKFASSSAVTTHQKVHSDLAPFTCSTCGKSMKTKKALIVHLNLHSNSKTHVCDQCGTAFATKGSLKMHMNNVHTDKPQMQNELYNKQCPDLSEHMRMHNSENPFQCVFAACVFRTNQTS